MIKTVADKRTRLFLEGKRVLSFQATAHQASQRLESLRAAPKIEELMIYTAIRFEVLGGDRPGHFSISINDQWRSCIRFENRDAWNVEITDYLGSLR
jgi:proteic killer suppression protein